MAGIGIKLNKIYRRNSLIARIYGYVYSTVITVAPMFVVIGAILLAQYLLRFSHASYLRRELFADTVLYTFIFSLLAVSPFNAVLSKYISDVIFQEKYEHIMPCFYLGMGMTVVFGTLFAIPFCIHEYVVGQVEIYYVLTGYFCFTSLMLVFYTTIYLSIAKTYGKISLFFTVGMLLTVGMSLALHYLVHLETTYALLLSLASGFSLTAALEIGLVRSFFRQNSGEYRPVLHYMRIYWQMIFINFLYTLGLYVHIFVFWTTDMRSVLVNTFVTAQPYDMASCLAMFTNISATIVFITNVELRFRDRYRRYYEAVLGGRGHDIDSARGRLFRQLSSEVFSLIRVQFIITAVVFLLCMVLLPMFGFAGYVMQIYPSLSVGYFILFVMYSEILFLYYFNDMYGALLTAVLFCGGTWLGSLFSSQLDVVWYGLGLIIGSLLGFSTAYFRLRHIEKTIDEQTFCPSGSANELVTQAKGKRPSSMVYSKRAAALKKDVKSAKGSK